MTNFSYTVFIVLIPFITFLVLGLFGNKIKAKMSGLIGTTALFVSFMLSLLTTYQYFFLSAKVEGAYQKILAFNFVWLRFTENLHVDLGVMLDPISVMMLVVVTTVSFVVHLYSIGYMHGERGFERFFAFLSLFSFAMLGLVVATNIFQMYIFWELVGVSSYLLIGFYYEKPSAILASKKAFIVTRFADLGFLVGILLLSFNTKTFDFIQLTDPNGPAMLTGAGAGFMGLSVLTWSLILIFIGGAGKSAMFPFHIWLPDAMEGPTPVSALIHAATMVVAGVFLVARLFPIYALQAPAGLHVVAYVGGFSSLFAAIIACTQYDIKRVLAFSTMSQIGYMMLGVGVSGYGENGLGFMASMFHLSTHAMFKALLFLGAGAIIHAVHSNYMYEMGGLRKYLPITHITFLIAVLTISGIPPFSGFWSKDEILAATHEFSPILFYNAVFVAGLTAFYMSRLYYNIFWGNDNRVYHHKPHEAPFTMTIPLIILALASTFGGFIPFHDFITTDGKPLHTHLDLAIAIPSVLVALVGIGIATVLYKKESNLPVRISKAFGAFYQGAFHKFYIDEVYFFVTKKIIFNNISRPVAWFDRHIVDGFMNLLAWITNFVANSIKGFQSGKVQQYGFVFVMGAIVLVIIFAYLTEL